MHSKKKRKISFKVKRRIIFAISAIIVALLYTFKNTSFTVRALSTIGLLVLFYLTDHLFYVDFKHRHYFFIVFIAITGFLLSPLYFIYPQYDKILHFIQPLMFSSIVFYMISGLDLELKWKLTFTFFVVIGSLGLFELGEYALDLTYDLKLQGVFQWDVTGLQKFDILQDRIDDTMIDLFIGTISTIIYILSIIIFFRKRV